MLLLVNRAQPAAVPQGGLILLPVVGIEQTPVAPGMTGHGLEDLLGRITLAALDVMHNRSEPESGGARDPKSERELRLRQQQLGEIGVRLAPRRRPNWSGDNGATPRRAA